MSELHNDEIRIREAGIEGFSFRGPRANNEDWIGYRIYDTNPLRMAIVLCDGVGGSDKGEVASRHIVAATLEFLENQPSKVPDEALFSKACDALADSLDQLAAEKNIKGAATTWCLVYISSGVLMAGHLGDSRIYVFESGEQKYESKDHSLVNDLLLAGMITPEEAVNHPQRNVITKAFQAGADHRSVGTFQLVPLKTSTRIMLCSDGFLPLYPNVFPKNPEEWNFDQLADECKTSTATGDNISVLLVTPNSIPDVVLFPTGETEKTHWGASEDQVRDNAEDVQIESQIDKRKSNKWVLLLLALLLLIATGMGTWFFLQQPTTSRKGQKNNQKTNGIPKQKQPKKQPAKSDQEQSTNNPDQSPNNENRGKDLKIMLKELKDQMRLIPSGTFMMGCTDEAGSICEDEEKPVHQVTLSAFQMGKYEVTQAQWEAVMGSNPSELKCAECPVVNISWNDVQGFISKLNMLTGGNYRLPTEAEWEYAARGGNAGSANSGNNSAWFGHNSGGKFHPVGKKQPNPLGLFDMSGNVMEWCQDFYSGEYYKKSPVENPGGPPQARTKVLRGDSYLSTNASTQRITFRFQYGPNHKSQNIGFRLSASKN